MIKYTVFFFFLFFSFKLSLLKAKSLNNFNHNIVILKKYDLDYKVREIIKVALKKNTYAKKIFELKHKLKKFYTKYGYLQFKLIIKKRIFLSNITYSIKISKGKQSKINKIKFLGSMHKPSNFYKKVFLNNADPIIQSYIYNPNLLKTSLKNLILYLQNKAYLTAKSVSIKQHWVTPYLVNISFIINEGPLSRVKIIKWAGLNSTEQDKITPLLKIKKNSKLIIKTLIDDDLFTVINFFKNQSYLDVKYKNNNNLIKYDEQQQASIYYQIIKGKISTLNKTIINGNKFTKLTTIKKTIPITQGDLITPKLLKTIYFNLENLNIFSEIRVSLKKSNHATYTKDLFIRVKEKNRTHFNTKLAIQSSQYNALSTKVTTFFVKKNLRGTGRKIYTGLEIKNRLNSSVIEYQTSLQYNQPFVFSSNIKAIVTMQSQKDIIDFNPSNQEYSLLRNQTSLSFKVNKKFNKSFSSYWTVLKFNKITEKSQDKNIHNVNTLNSTSILNIFDFRNSRFNPTKGHYEDFQILYTKPIFRGSENIHFFQITSNLEYYVPLGRLTWAGKLSLGYAKNLFSTANSGIPSNFAFFLGGPSSLRGYAGGSDRFPSPEELPLNKSSELIIKDFTYFYLLKSELRIPIVKPFYSSVFYDIGSVKVDNLSFYNPIRSSYGVGLHFSTPIGVLSLNYGIKANPSPKEGSYSIHFSIGSF